MMGENQAKSEKTRVYAQKSRLELPFKNSISGNMKDTGRESLEKYLEIIRYVKCRVHPTVGF
jgi:hypothetical protein